MGPIVFNLLYIPAPSFYFVAGRELRFCSAFLSLLPLPLNAINLWSARLPNVKRWKGNWNSSLVSVGTHYRPPAHKRLVRSRVRCATSQLSGRPLRSQKYGEMCIAQSNKSWKGNKKKRQTQNKIKKLAISNWRKSIVGLVVEGSFLTASFLTFGLLAKRIQISRQYNIQSTAVLAPLP